MDAQRIRRHLLLGLRVAARLGASVHSIDVAAQIELRAHVEEVPVDRERKAERLAAYSTQIPHLSPPEGRLDSPKVLPPTERYWLLRRR